MQFIDEATVHVAAGNGGDGLVAWRREKYIPKGGPAGGDGGHGGSVYVRATSAVSTLVEFRYRRSFEAESGHNGGASNKSGRSGNDLTIDVPIGTLVYRAREGMEENLTADLAGADERVLIARGGRGGAGNARFATSVRQAPHFAEKGEPGERYTLRFELKLLADCAVVGVPNAGKSTLLSVVSAARPKIADYPFTTIEPQLGVVRVSDETSFVMVDVPGLIEGAHGGAGLGDRFLRHAERTRVLLHLLDGAKPLDEMLREKETIESELRSWHAPLLEKPSLLCVSKLDLPQARDNLVRLQGHVASVRGISAVTGEGVRDLVYAISRALDEAPAPVRTEPVARIELVPRDAFTVERERDGSFLVRGERVERLAATTNFDSDEALARLQRALERIGVERKLKDMGARAGDTVRIGAYEFTYS